MEMSGERQIPAPPEVVWKGLNDPNVLKQSIPGCEEIEKVSDTEFTAKVVAKIGPVKARFGGKVTLSDLNPPRSYKISGEGQGGAAGFAKGGAEVELEPGENGGTLMRYKVNAQIGGKMAQIGARLIDGTARKLADQFFDTFVKTVSDGDRLPSGEHEPTAAPSLPPAMWIPALVGAVGILLGIFGTA
jgi:carbon monoxide dehydrogenase subunit G